MRPQISTHQRESVEEMRLLARLLEIAYSPDSSRAVRVNVGCSQDQKEQQIS